MVKAKYIAPSASSYLRYYQQQHGGALPYFKGSAYYGQRGAGLGAIFTKILGGIRGLISRTPQWLKDTGKMAAKQVVRTGGELIGEAARSGNAEEFKQRARRKMKEGSGQLISDIGAKIQQGKGIKRRRKPVKKTFQQKGKGIKRRRISGKKIKRSKRKKATRTKLDFLD